MIQDIILLILAILILPFVLPKAFLHIKRVRIEWRRINRLESERKKIAEATHLTMEHMMNIVGGLDKRTAVKVLRDHVKTLKNRVLAYLPTTSQRVKRQDITELGLIRQAYSMLGLSLYVKPYPVPSCTVVIPSSPISDVDMWRSYISTELNKMSESREHHVGFGAKEKEQLSQALSRWLTAGFDDEHAAYFKDILDRDINTEREQDYARG